MKRRHVIRFALSSLVETTWRRLRGEPIADSWPFRFEWVWGVIRKSFEAGRGAPPQKVRRTQEEIARDPKHEVGRIRTTVGGVDCEWFLTDPSATAAPSPGSPAVVYLHGGGYFFGSTDTHAAFLARLTRSTELPVLGVNYRLCPEHSVEDAIDDVVAVVGALDDAGWQPGELAVAGDSAGGGLAVSSSVALRDRGLEWPAALGLISPWVDMRCAADSHRDNSATDYMTGEMVERIADLVLDGRPPDNPICSPVCGDLAGLPPTLIHAGGAEVLLDDSRLLADRLEAAGVEVTLEVWPEMVHVFHNFAHLLPQADTAISGFSDFLVEALETDRSHPKRPVRETPVPAAG